MNEDEDLKKFTKCDIFTPENICKLMASKLKNKGSILDPAVGTGNLLEFVQLKNYTNIDVYDIKNKYLDSFKYKNINKHNEDFLKSTIETKYDNIIMNPPYIRIQDLSPNYREFIKEKFTILNQGLVDIYYAFIIKCIDLLKDDGIMVAITPNSYLYNKSALQLRKYLFENNLVKEIIDYKSEKVFNNASVYCCITIFTKSKKTYLLYNGEKLNYNNITKNYSLFNFNSQINTLKNICKISNGIATLRDKVFIHKEKLYNEPCWNLVTNGKEEKHIIYPYKNGEIIDEKSFKELNPKTYEYLQDNKNILAERDKGNKVYPAWYAYGRSQSIKYSSKVCIYIPCFIDPNEDLDKYLYVKKGMLHQSCICFEPKENVSIETIIETLKKNIEFISSNSSKRGSGWINLTTRVLYEVPID